MARKYKEGEVEMETRAVANEDFSINAEIVEKTIEEQPQIIKKGPPKVRYKVENKSLQVINILLDGGSKSHQLLAKQSIILEKRQISAQMSNLKNKGVLTITEIKE